MTSDFYENEKITEKEKQIGTKKAFLSLLPYLKEHSKRLFIALILLSGGTFLSLVWPILLKNGIDGPLKEKDFNGLLIIAGIIGLIQIVTIVIQYFMRIKLEIIGQDIMLKLKQKLFDHILSLDISFFDKNPVGRLMARVESDAEALRLLFTNTVVLIVADIFLLSGIYGVLFYYNWKMALILIVSIPIIGLFIWIFHRTTTHRFLEVRKRMAEVTATLTEFLHSMSIVQIFHRGSYARARVYKVNEAKFSEDAYVNIAACIFFNTVFFFEYVKIGLVLILGSHFGMTFGTMVMFLLYIWRSFEPIFRTSEQLSNFQKAVAGAKRIFAILSEKSRLLDPAYPVEWNGLEKEIRFENVWFSYTDDENYVLRDVSFSIPVGKTVAIAGVTGGGKTTVISLILRLYDPQKGKITVDGIDIRDIPKSELRKRFALVLQDIILFPGDIKSNISLESERISENRITDASKQVEADKFIKLLPEDYKTVVSEKGSNFSRGERQLLSFARALAIDPEVLILDEATSSVDPETERTIQSSLKKLMSGRTSLVIAHRLATILEADQILVIRHGEIIERGTHTDLILKNGYYSRLFHLQFKNKNGVASNA
ncbi:MAG: ABC transporter ATP-binding protein [Candidatus Zixiibacteriota bacterium]|nr:MAG: ABC transporter ATP-binding protein [candidate division Zixibacteria bacterium]